LEKRIVHFEFGQESWDVAGMFSSKTLISFRLKKE